VNFLLFLRTQHGSKVEVGDLYDLCTLSVAENQLRESKQTAGEGRKFRGTEVGVADGGIQSDFDE
jgi:hypothetical protein